MHSPPIFTGYLPVSHRRIAVIPLLPAQRFSHRSSTVSPSEVTTPRPVMTTRRLLMVGCYWLLVSGYSWGSIDRSRFGNQSVGSASADAYYQVRRDASAEADPTNCT